MSLSTLEDLFLHDLKDTYDAEKQILKALPRMAKKVSSPELKAAFEEHIEMTEQQIERLERIFEQLSKAARGKRCLGMAGLLEEGSELMQEEEQGCVLDAALIGAAQKVEHYEISAYGTLLAHAKLLEMSEAVEILQETLDEEKQTDERLTELSAEINWSAEAGEEKEENTSRDQAGRQAGRGRAKSSSPDDDETEAAMAADEDEGEEEGATRRGGKRSGSSRGTQQGR